MPDWPVPLRPSLDAALRDITSESENARLAATASLAYAEGDDVAKATVALGVALEDSSEKVKAQAALALAELGPDSALDVLIELAEPMKGAVAQAAIIALGESGDSQVLPTLRKGLDAPDADVRFQAVIAIARSAGADALEPLRSAARDDDEEVRANVAAALADLDLEEGLPILESLLEDEHVAVRFEAALALAAKGRREATPVLLESLNDQDAAPQALQALGGLGDPRARGPLRTLAGRWLVRAPIRAAAAAALASLGDDQGRRELEKWLSSRRREPRAMAIYCAGEFRVRSVVDRLCAMLADPSQTDRDSIAHALGLIGDPSARKCLEPASRDAEADVAEEARQALEKLERYR